MLCIGHIIVVTNMFAMENVLFDRHHRMQLLNKCRAIVLNLKWDTKQRFKHHATLEEAGQYDTSNAPLPASPACPWSLWGLHFRRQHLQVSSWDGEQLVVKRASFSSPWDWWSLGPSTAVNIPTAMSEQQSNTHHWQLASPKPQLDHYRLKARTHTSCFRENRIITSKVMQHKEIWSSQT